MSAESSVRYTAYSQVIESEQTRENGCWQKVSFVQDGSYLVFTLELDDTTISIVETAPHDYVFYTIVLILSLTVAIALLMYVRNRKRRNSLGSAKANNASQDTSCDDNE